MVPYLIFFKVRDSVRFLNWIMGWDDLIEVLEPHPRYRKIADKYLCEDF